MDKQFIAKLENLNACEDSIEWLSTQDNLQQAWKDCERGDWLLWLVARLNINERKLFLAKGLVAEQVIHLMNDERSIEAVKAAINYGNGKISKDELSADDAATLVAAYANAAGAYAAYGDYIATIATTAAAAAAYANAAAAYAANTYDDNAAVAAAYAANAATNTAIANAYAASDAAAEQLSFKKSAAIVREIFVFEEIIEASKTDCKVV